MNLVTYATEAEWLDARRKLVTSSDLPAILGLLPDVSPFALWLEKTQGGGRESKYLMRRGHALEDFIAAEYARETARPTVDPGSYALAIDDWRGATVDRFFVDHPKAIDLEAFAGVDGILEIKAPTVYGMHKYRAGPDKYVTAQVQWQMLVTGLPFADVAVDMTTRLDIFRVNANPKLQAALEREAERFREYVDSGEPPPIDGHPGTARALAEFFAEPIEETVTLPPEAREWFDRRKCAIDAVDQYKAERAEAENWFRAQLGQATEGSDSELSLLVTWKPDVNGVRKLLFKEIQR